MGLFSIQPLLGSRSSGTLQLQPAFTLTFGEIPHMLRCLPSSTPCAVAAVLACLLFFASPPTASAQPKKPVSFINDVAPILKENCFACHDSKKKSGKYDMTTFEKLLTGGANGDPLVAGKPEASEFHSLMVTTEQRRMPPRDKGEEIGRAHV